MSLYNAKKSQVVTVNLKWAKEQIGCRNPILRFHQPMITAYDSCKRHHQACRKQTVFSGLGIVFIR